MFGIVDNIVIRGIIDQVNFVTFVVYMCVCVRYICCSAWVAVA